MNTPRLNVERELGIISATLDQIQTDIRETKAAQIAMGNTLSLSLRAQEQLQREMATVKPVVDEMSRWKLIGLGAMMTVGAIGAMIGLTLATAKTWLINAIWGG